MTNLLIDAYKLRYSSQMVLNTSNIDNQSASSANDTFLAAVIVDVQADFSIKARVTLDSTNVHPDHVATACLGIYLRSTSLSGTNTELKGWDRYEKELESIYERSPRELMVNKINYDRWQTPLSTTQRRQRNSLPSLYSFGQASCSGVTVTGYGTVWKTQPEGKIATNNAIAFGFKDPNVYKDTDWYIISSVDSDTQLTLTSSAGTVARIDYVIELDDERAMHS